MICIGVCAGAGIIGTAATEVGRTCMRMCILVSSARRHDVGDVGKDMLVCVHPFDGAFYACFGMHFSDGAIYVCLCAHRGGTFYARFERTFCWCILCSNLYAFLMVLVMLVCGTATSEVGLQITVPTSSFARRLKLFCYAPCTKEAEAVNLPYLH